MTNADASLLNTDDAPAPWWHGRPGEAPTRGAIYDHHPHAYDPWEHLQAMRCAGDKVRVLPMHDGHPGNCLPDCDPATCTTWGTTNFERREISLCWGLSPAEVRATLAHELIHLERGPVLDEWDPVEERVVELVTCLRLIPAEEWPTLAARCEAEGFATVADALCIDRDLLVIALDLLPMVLAKLDE